MPPRGRPRGSRARGGTTSTRGRVANPNAATEAPAHEDEEPPTAQPQDAAPTETQDATMEDAPGDPVEPAVGAEAQPASTSHPGLTITTSSVQETATAIDAASAAMAHDAADLARSSSIGAASAPMPSSVTLPPSCSETPRRVATLAGVGAGPGAPSGRRALMPQPRGRGRRSAEERQRLQEQEDARRAEQMARLGTVQPTRSAGVAGVVAGGGRGGSGGGVSGARSRGQGRQQQQRGAFMVGPGRGRGRGGFMGDVIASGPFSSGMVSRDTSRFVQRGRPTHSRGGFGSVGASSKPGGPRIKTEAKIKQEDNQDVPMTGVEGNEGVVKREPEDGGYISSDPDEGHEGPLLDVDYINLISDDGTSDEEGGPRSINRRRRPQFDRMSLAPVRLQRHEHKERVVGINTEASSATTAELRRIADETGTANVEEALASAIKKGKAKAKDMEVISDVREFKGAYDEDELDDVTAVRNELAAPETSKPRPESPTSTKKKDDKAIKLSPSSKRRKNQKPVFQTDQDLQEYERRMHDMQVLRDELGSITIAPAETAGEDESILSEQQLPDKKADRVYLFQLPPVLPDLATAQSPPTKREGRNESPTETRAGTSAAQDQNATAAPAKESVTIKQDPGAEPQQGAAEQGPTLAPGYAGKLRIHKSGRATLSWGGASFQMKMGMDTEFLQDVMVVKMDEQPEGDEDGEGAAAKRPPGHIMGETLSFGQVRGKFVVTPDWEEIMGSW
ncbi:RNA polymerase III RPC4-domain-containing protein [Lineolata rhizophorae]|uniref:RNA polymerase III RPC4-domain-containing protein n=1 Tax=Lineolata rhizophorae TaxID=578093 RepID=A0A6A6NPC8_9PEZI|nr:RNA polymerase III RPC4-domain-containing protein [Lineolata rhizophorae]